MAGIWRDYSRELSACKGVDGHSGKIHLDLDQRFRSDLAVKAAPASRDALMVYVGSPQGARPRFADGGEIELLEPIGEF